MNKKVVKEIQRMSAEIPPEITQNLMKEVPVYSALIGTVELGLQDPNTKPELRRKLELIKDSGMLNETEMVVDEDAEKKLDDWWAKALEKAQKEGRIPKPKEGADSLQKLIKKGKQNARRNNASSKRTVDNGPEQGGDKTDSTEGLLSEQGGGPGEGGSGQN